MAYLQSPFLAWCWLPAATYSMPSPAQLVYVSLAKRRAWRCTCCSCQWLQLLCVLDTLQAQHYLHTDTVLLFLQPDWRLASYEDSPAARPPAAALPAIRWSLSASRLNHIALLPSSPNSQLPTPQAPPSSPTRGPPAAATCSTPAGSRRLRRSAGRMPWAASWWRGTAARSRWRWSGPSSTA